MKKISLIIASLLIFSSFIFYSCKKEDKLNNTNGSVNVSKPNNPKRSTENPFDFVGVEHNQYLDYLSANCNVNAITKIDIYNANKGFFSDYSLTYDQFEQQLLKNQDQILKLSNGEDNNLVNNDYNDELTKLCLTQFNDLIGSLVKNDELVSPDFFSLQIEKIEQSVIEQGLYSLPDTDTINNHARVLCFLSIAKHSYNYWYNAYMDNTNPWHNIVYSAVNSNSKGIFGALWTGIKAIGKAIVTPFADAYGFLSPSPENVEFSNPMTGQGPTITYSLSTCIHSAGQASASVW
ncbi:MAG: hypothetical protein WCO13_03830 [Bacteroidota bacterium]